MQRQRALDLGYTLNEHGMHEMKNGNKGAKVEGDFPDEQSIFKFLGMKYKAPNERRDGRSVQLEEKQPAQVNEAPVGPDMQDVGKAEAVGMSEPVAPVAQTVIEKKKAKKARKTVKKLLLLHQNLISQF